MDILVNSYAVSPSNGDVRGEDPQWRTGKKPQDRFADIPILANVGEETRSDSKGDGEGDLGADVQREQDARNARERDRYTARSSHVAVVASDAPMELPVQTKDGTSKGDSAPAQSSKTSYQEPMTAESPDAGSKRQATLVSQSGKNGQCARAVGGTGGKNGSFGTPVAGPFGPKGSPAATPHTLHKLSQNALSRKQSLSLAASPGSETKFRGPESEGQLRAGSKRGSASGSLNPAMEALVSRGKETQAGGHKSGAGTSPGPSACLVSQPAAAAPHTSVGAAAYGSVDGGASESISQSVGDQILDSLKASMAQGDRQVLIRLQPPELGMVLVRFREQGEHLDGLFKVDRADTRREIEQVLPEVVRSLQDAGVGIRRIDVTEGDAPAQDLGGGQSQQEGSSGYRDAGQERDHLRASLMPGLSAGAASSGDSRPVPDVQDAMKMPRGRIDMLL